MWGENPKQSEWRRAGDWPVGMKNIGNTCWFSAVIQVTKDREVLLESKGLSLRVKGAAAHRKGRSASAVLRREPWFCVICNLLQASMERCKEQ